VEGHGDGDDERPSMKFLGIRYDEDHKTSHSPVSPNPLFMPNWTFATFEFVDLEDDVPETVASRGTLTLAGVIGPALMP
jgi:hypothetical protein